MPPLFQTKQPGWRRKVAATNCSCLIPYFQYNRNMSKRPVAPPAARYAEMFAAMGAEPRLRIMQLLLSSHPQGLVAGEIQDELGIPASTLSHHLDKLKSEDLVRVRREGTFLWYTANTDSLRAVMDFLYAECCTRSRAIEPRELVTLGVAAGLARHPGDVKLPLHGNNSERRKK
jgi:ArsR family transcriptional regulator, arsenate/arsenite/antimonite-responsive transcriptional repressor